MKQGDTGVGGDISRVRGTKYRRHQYKGRWRRSRWHQLQVLAGCMEQDVLWSRVSSAPSTVPLASAVGGGDVSRVCGVGGING